VILEAQVESLMPKPVAAPPSEQSVVKTRQTFWEIWSIVNGRRGAHPICAPSLVRAQEEAAYVARGDLLDNFGHRAPAKPIFELTDGETLDDAIRHGDGLYITKKTIDGSCQLNF
jgi:hypothetical protein